jgi:hypothetical protein
VVSGSLPDGLGLEPATGRLQGTPAEADTFPIVVAARDSIGCTGTGSWVLAIFATPPVSSVAADATGLMISNGLPCVGVPVKYTRGESTPVGSVHVTFQLEPARLALCTPGTPAASVHPGPWLDGHSSASFSVTDAGDKSYDVDLSLIGEPCGIEEGGTLFTLDLAAAGPDGSGTISVTAVQVRECSGALVPVAPGPPASLTINRQPLTLQPAAVPGGSLGTPYAAQLTTDAGTAPFTWTVDSGTLPAGLALDAGSGAIGGTPAATGTSFIDVSAVDVNGRTGTRSYSISIFASPPTSLVNPVTTGRCITPAQPVATVPFHYARTDSAPARAVSVTFQVDTSKIALGTPADPPASIHAGTWFSGNPGVLFALDHGGGSYTVDVAIVGPQCGITGGGELFTVDLAAVAGEGNAEIRVLAVRARDCLDAAVPVAAGPPSWLTIHAAGPPAIVDLAAEAMIVTGGSDSTTRIRVDWSPSPGGRVDLYRAARGTYPLYADASPPPDSSLAPGGPWVHVATDPAPGFEDLPPARGVWDYVALTTDSCGVSAISNTTRGTLDYLLGDVSNGIVAGTGDNSVGTADISLLGACYGRAGAPAVDPVGYLDVGPTLSGMPDSPPLPDHRIDLEDLFIFSVNYGTSAGSPAPQRPARAARMARAARAASPLLMGPDRFAVVGPSSVDAGAEVTASLRLTAGGRMHAFSVQLAWDATVVEPIGVEPAGFIEAQGGVVLTPQPGTVDAALLGAGGDGITGEGEVARVRFRALRAGLPGIGLFAVDGRDAANQPILPTTSVPPATSRTLLLAPTPNPARGTATLAYALDRAGAVTLAVYDVQGRCVRTLVNAVQEAGAYQVRWNGRDDGGRALAAGVYHLSLDAGGRRMVRTLVLIR